MLLPRVAKGGLSGGLSVPGLGWVCLLSLWGLVFLHTLPATHALNGADVTGDGAVGNAGNADNAGIVGNASHGSECGQPVTSFNSRDLTVDITNKDLRLRRLFAELNGEPCVMAKGYQCGREERRRRHDARRAMMAGGGGGGGGGGKGQAGGKGGGGKGGGDMGKGKGGMAGGGSDSDGSNEKNDEGKKSGMGGGGSSGKGGGHGGAGAGGSGAGGGGNGKGGGGSGMGGGGSAKGGGGGGGGGVGMKHNGDGAMSGKRKKMSYDDNEEAGQRGPDGRKRCSKFGKLTMLKFLALSRLNKNSTVLSKSIISAILYTGGATNATVPNAMGANGIPVKALKFVMTLIFPGKDPATNATAAMIVYVIEDAGNLTLGRNLVVPLHKGQLKFNLQIDDPANWLCSAGETGDQCAASLKLQLQLAGESRQTGRHRREQMRKSRKCIGKMCIENVVAPDGSMLSSANTAKIDGVDTEMKQMTVDADGTMTMVFDFKNNIVIDPIVAPATEEDKPLPNRNDVTTSRPATLFLLLTVALALLLNI